MEVLNILRNLFSGYFYMFWQPSCCANFVVKLLASYIMDRLSIFMEFVLWIVLLAISDVDTLSASGRCMWPYCRGFPFLWLVGQYYLCRHYILLCIVEKTLVKLLNESIDKQFGTKLDKSFIKIVKKNLFTNHNNIFDIKCDKIPDKNPGCTIICTSVHLYTYKLFEILPTFTIIDICLLKNYLKCSNSKNNFLKIYPLEMQKVSHIHYCLKIIDTYMNILFENYYYFRSIFFEKTSTLNYMLNGFTKIIMSKPKGSNLNLLKLQCFYIRCAYKLPTLSIRSYLRTYLISLISYKNFHNFHFCIIITVLVNLLYILKRLKYFQFPHLSNLNDLSFLQFLYFILLNFYPKCQTKSHVHEIYKIMEFTTLFLFTHISEVKSLPFYPFLIFYSTILYIQFCKGNFLVHFLIILHSYRIFLA